MNCGDVSNPMAWTIATITDISQRKAARKEKYEMERLQGVLEMAGNPSWKNYTEIIQYYPLSYR